MKIDWKRKLTSRKFWLAIAGFIGGILAALKLSEEVITEVTGVIMSAASVVAYIIGEGLSDAASAGVARQEAEQEQHG